MSIYVNLENRSDMLSAVECHAMHFPRLKVGIVQRNMWKWLPDKGDLMLLRQWRWVWLGELRHPKGTNHGGLEKRYAKWIRNGPEMDENNAAKYSRIAQAELLSCVSREAWKAIAMHPNQQWQRTAARSAQTL